MNDNTPQSKGQAGFLRLFFTGMAMGAADAVPGVSGGTIAVMARIYERLVLAIRATVPACRQLFSGAGLMTAWRTLDGSFLLVLASGILTSLYLVANLVLALLQSHYALVMAFFCGLVLSSARILRSEVGRWTRSTLAMGAVAAALTVAVSLGSPVEVREPSGLYLFFGGAIAISAMILPGLSGAFILLLLGIYAPVLSALRELDWATILIFAAGCFCGLLSFAHLLGWVFQRFRSQTYAAIIGMLYASIVALWPWRTGVGEEQAGALLLPWRYEAVTGQAAQPWLALALLVTGYVLIVFFERMAGRMVRREWDCAG